MEKRRADEDALLWLTGLIPLTVAAARTGATPATLRRLIANRSCSGRKFGGRWFVNWDAVDRWAQRRRGHGGAPTPPPDRATWGAAYTCPCETSNESLGDMAATQLAVRARRCHALERLIEQELLLAMDLTLSDKDPTLPSERARWIDAVIADAARDAAQTGLAALLDALASRLSEAPSDVLSRLDRADMRYALELA